MQTVRVRVSLNTKNPSSKVAAYASTQYDGCLVISNIKILRIRDDLITAWPRRPDPKDPTKTLKSNIAYPCTTEIRQYLHSVIVEEYERVTGGIDDDYVGNVYEIPQDLQMIEEVI